MQSMPINGDNAMCCTAHLEWKFPRQNAHVKVNNIPLLSHEKLHLPVLDVKSQNQIIRLPACLKF